MTIVPAVGVVPSPQSITAVKSSALPKIVGGTRSLKLNEATSTLFSGMPSTPAMGTPVPTSWSFALMIRTCSMFV